FGFYGVDLLEAFTEKNAADQAAAFIRARDDQPTIWYVGHWGFQHYAEREGMKPVAPRQREPRADDSKLRIGDWLVVPDEGLTRQALRVEKDKVRQVGEVRCEDAVPLRTVICFYSGR